MANKNKNKSNDYVNNRINKPKSQENEPYSLGIKNYLRMGSVEDFSDDIFGDISFNTLYSGLKEKEVELEKKSVDILNETMSETSKEISDELVYDTIEKTDRELDEKQEVIQYSENEEESKSNAKKVKESFSFDDILFTLIATCVGFFSTLYKITYVLGLQTYRYSRRIFKSLLKLALKPIKFFVALLRMLCIAIDHFAFRSLHSFLDELAYFRREVRCAISYISKAIKQSPLSIFHVILYYIKLAFKRHRVMFRSVANVFLPVIAIVVLSVTVSYWNSVTFALKVTYNNNELGYIEKESVYLEAKNMVKDKLNSFDSSLIDAEEFTKTPKYELSLVSLNEIKDSSDISDKLIEFSDTAITNACGVYIDGEFLCAVKNETDAKSVFSNVLAEYEKGLDSNDAMVNFVEDIEYFQGLYPENEDVVWDASRLAKKLETNKEEAVYYTVAEGDNPYDIALSYGMTEKQLRNINPQIGKYIKAGDKVLVSTQVKYVRVKVIKTEQLAEPVPYETVKTDNPNRFKGDDRVVRAGVKGEDSVTYLVTYINNTRISAEEVSRTRTKEPIAKKVQVGTKSTRVSSSSGSYNVSISKGGFVWPTPGLRTITSYYGPRSSGYHYGIDISGSNARGKLIVASRAGIVESAGPDGSYGYQVLINHGNGIKTRYAHCMKGSISVSRGQYVNAGQAIARVGSTGRASGSHLHFEIILNGRRVNPLNYLR